MNKTRKRANKGFTLIELLVVIAVLGILTLLAMPRFKGYVEKAQLARIKHDVKVMENKMEESLMNNPKDWETWDTNGKDLYKLVGNQRLFETKGVATKVNREHVKGLNNKRNARSINDNMGGLMVLSEEDNEDVLDKVSAGYKIIPNEYKKNIGTRLKGTFYSNNLGKVYYEPDKPLNNVSEKQLPNCPVLDPDEYTFEHREGRIVKYHGKEQHLVIPSAFLVKDPDESEARCWPVRIIGRGAFAQIPLKSVVIPDSVEKIEDGAFEKNDLEDIIIPPSVEEIGPGAFEDNKLDKPIIQRPKEDIEIGDGAFDNNGPNKDTPAKPEFEIPTDEDLGVDIEIERDENDKPIGGVIIDAERPKPIKPNKPNKPGTPEEPGEPGKPEKPNKPVKPDDSIGGGSITIPDKIIVGGEEIPITGIEKGAYQGLGLITVKLPEGLERIEDYAFSGNQLIGITIPNNVRHIGNYAFSFNEVHKIGNIAGPDSIATIKTIIIKEKEQFSKVNKYGDILENGKKVDIYSNGDGVDVRLLVQIFVTSIGNIVIDEEGGGKPGEPEEPEKPIEPEEPEGEKPVIPEPSIPVIGAGDDEYGFHGEVSSEELISPRDLAEMVDIRGYKNINVDPGWLKFTDKGRTLFVLKKSITSVNLTSLKSSNIINGNRIVEINGNEYKVRLLRGANDSFDVDVPIAWQPDGKDIYRNSINHNSEWNRLMLPIHEKVINGNWLYPKNVENNIPNWTQYMDKAGVGTGINGGYTDEDLEYDVGTKLVTSYVQENTSSYTATMLRGGNKDVSLATQLENGTSTSMLAGWRPVLELIDDSNDTDVPNNDKYVLAKHTDFRFHPAPPNISSQNYYYTKEGYGNYKYIGSDEYVEIPHNIRGTDMVKYAQMFNNANVKGVKSTNKNVISMYSMFAGNKSDTLDLSELCTDNVTDANYMFNAIKVNKLDLSNLNMNNVTSMSGMFYNAEINKLNLPKLDASKTTRVANMFSGAKIDKVDLSTINMSKVSSMTDMFKDAEINTINMFNLNLDNIIGMSGMFTNAKIDKLDMSGINASKLKNVGSMFENAEINTLSLNKFNVPNLKSMSGMFKSAKIKTLDMSELNANSITNMNLMFENAEINTLNLDGIDTSNVTNMDSMFEGAKFNAVNLSEFNVDKVIFMRNMFKSAEIGMIDLSGLDIANLKYMTDMFRDAKIETLDLSNVRIPQITSLYYMFGNVKLNTLKVSGFDTSNITSMGNMFANAEIINLDLSEFNTSNVTTMQNMFYGAKMNIIDLSSFDTSKTTNVNNMFKGTTAIKGYARTQIDAEKLNKSTGKPSTLIFEVK